MKIDPGWVLSDEEIAEAAHAKARVVPPLRVRWSALPADFRAGLTQAVSLFRFRFYFGLPLGGNFESPRMRAFWDEVRRLVSEEASRLEREKC